MPGAEQTRVGHMVLGHIAAPRPIPKRIGTVAVQEQRRKNGYLAGTHLDGHGTVVILQLGVLKVWNWPKERRPRALLMASSSPLASAWRRSSS
ncbi:MAG: hypothetical protein O3B95_11775 [Chloroflexi bacterium]|nr:hypothetical protein [Chloroflexota bacterium]